MPKSYVKARLQAVKKLKQFLSKAFTYQVAVYTGGVSQLEWREGGQLLEPRYGLRATMLDNILYVTGGYPGSSLTSILSWEKRLQNDRKYAIFQNWLDTRPKMETHDPNVYPTILGGVSRGFWTPFLDQGARSAIILHLIPCAVVKAEDDLIYKLISSELTHST